MKKIFKLLFVLCFMVVFGVNSVNADTVKVNTASSVKNLIGGSYNVTMRKDANGNYLYCLDFGKTSPVVGATYNKSGEADAGVAYIIQNGYPNGLTSYGEAAGVFITQSALWWYQASYNGGKSIGVSSKVGSNNYGTEIKKLYDGAVSARNNGYTTSSMSVSPSSVTLTESGDYFKSSNITVTTSGSVSEYTVTLSGAPSDAEVVKNGNSFYVQIPTDSVSEGSTSFTINVSASGSTTKAYIYTPTNSKYQSMALSKTDSSDLTDSVSASLNKEVEETTVVEETEVKNSVYISKQDITNKEELPGAKLTVKDSDGNIIDSWISTNEPHYLEGLAAGTYTLTEEVAPDGYELSSETITFEIVDGEVASTVVMYNTPETDDEEEEVIETKKTDSSNVIFYVIFGALATCGGALVYRNRHAK